jgi:hypothetical protein
LYAFLAYLLIPIAKLKLLPKYWLTAAGSGAIVGYHSPFLKSIHHRQWPKVMPNVTPFWVTFVTE